MTYSGKTNWASGNTVMPSDMNRIEQGIVDAVRADGTVPFTAEQIGVNPTSAQGLVTKSYFENNIPAIVTKFSVNKGSKDSVGESNFLSFSGSVITLESTDFVACNATGDEITLAGDLTYTNTANSGVQWLYINSTGTTLSVVGSFYVQSYQPTPSTTAIWLDTSQEPLVAQYYNGTSWSTFTGVIVGRYLVTASAITKMYSMDFNDNFYNPKERGTYGFGTVSGSTVYLKQNRYQEVTFSGASSICIPTNLPPIIRNQCVVEMSVSTVSPTITYNITPNWVNNIPVPLSSTTAIYRVTFETKDGNSYRAFWTQIGV